MNSSSEQVGSLRKGDSVYVDLRMDQNGRSWCGVRPSRQSNRTGFVDCRALERVASSIPSVSPAPGVTSGSARGLVAEVPLARPTPPTIAGYDSVKRETVKDGVIDSAYIATLDAQAAGGNSAAVTRAALAHMAAGEFELGEHEPDKATEHFQAMQRYAGNQRALLGASLHGRIYALIMKSDYSAALELLPQARTLNPQSAPLAALSGYAHYHLNQMEAATADLQAAQKLKPDPHVAALLAKTQRDSQVEGDFSEGESSHFVLRYNGTASRQLASDIVHTLEDDFSALRDELHYTPPAPISVILYTRENFRDLTGAPDWAGALNDGRIRVAAQGIDSVPPALARSLKHELTHSFLFQKTQGRCPTWMHEGMAQLIVGFRSGPNAAKLVQMVQTGEGKKLRNLEGQWMKFSSDESWFGYAWSLATVEAIYANYGDDGIERLLDAMRSEPSAEAALLQGLRTHYSGLDDATLDYLRRTYPQ